MGLFDRFSKVVSSNLNALLDKAEDPEKSLGLLLDEMREQIRKGRQEVVEALSMDKQILNKINALQEQKSKWQRRAELAVKAGDEALAREALLLRRRLDSEQTQLENQRSEQQARALRLKDELREAEAKLRDFSARKGTIAARYAQARAGGGAEALGAHGTGPTPLEEFDRITDRLETEQERAVAMSEATSLLETPAGSSRSASEIEAQFAALEQSERSTTNDSDDVEEELNALRGKFRVNS